MLKIDIPREKLGAGSYSHPDGAPKCLIGHVMHALKVPYNCLSGYYEDTPKELKFLVADNSISPAWMNITHFNDEAVDRKRPDMLDKALEIFKEHDIVINLT